MTDLLLRAREQALVRALLASEPVPGAHLPGECTLPHLARLVDCDALGIALLDGTGAIVGEVAMLRDRTTGETLVAGDGAAPFGAVRSRGASSGRALPGGLALDLWTLRVPNGTDHVARLWLIRTTTGFTHRDRALLALVAPVLERALREQPTPSPLPSSLTEQERRVLRLVATGLANAEVAERLVVAPSTVRKHLEHAYRKLGVTNRLAAVHALEGRGPADLDRFGGVAGAAVDPRSGGVTTS